MEKLKLDRDTYKTIKKMNREEMNQFLRTLYHDSFKEGSNSAAKIDFRLELSELLQGTKGVGDVLYNRIMLNAKGDN